jgi:hypothetical protein
VALSCPPELCSLATGALFSADVVGEQSTDLVRQRDERDPSLDAEHDDGIIHLGAESGVDGADMCLEQDLDPISRREEAVADRDGSPQLETVTRALGALYGQLGGGNAVLLTTAVADDPSFTIVMVLLTLLAQSATPMIMSLSSR